MTYGETIKRHREALCLTQEQLAESLDVSRQAVSKWEANLSRPARAKLERLSEVLEIPPETWAAIDAEQAAAEQPADTARPWKIAAAILAALCVSLGIALAVVLWRQAHPSTLVPSDSAQADIQPDDSGGLSQAFPEALPLTVRHDFDFGDAPLGEYDSFLIPYLDDPAEVLEHALWEDTFPDGVRISLVDGEEYMINEEPFYCLYLLYALPGGPWQILCRIADDLGDPWDSQPKAAAFTNVLDRDGFKLELYFPSLENWDVTYLSQRPDGVPCMMHCLFGESWEADIDEDGTLEIVYSDPFRPIWEMIDTEEGEEGAFVYTLAVGEDGLTPEGVGFAPEKGGFTASDSQNTVLARYILQDGQLVRRPLTDFSPLDWPDVAGTEVIFVTQDGDGLSDGRDPDEVLYNGTSQITHRQQAYLALQELYNLTGFKIDSCYCAASEWGVHFSLLPDGCNQRCFYSAYFSEDYGGGGIPSLYFAWKELGSDWSPLSFEDAAHPEAWVEEENILRWYYERLQVFRTGEAARETCGEFAWEWNLYLENGDLFVGRFQNTQWGPALVNLIGPYPDGEVNH